ncbi:MAG: DctP family TRAP transporter solute-binding subunit [Emergencia sp.]|nr:DctP family TRAP transporter solute-binding subunit [Emergencia sp.]
MKKKVFALIMTLAAVMIGFTACGGSDEPAASGEKETWKLAHTESQDTMYDMWANQFAKLVNEKSDGRITVEVYPVGQLGDSAAQLEMIQTGGIDIGIFASGDVGSTFPAAQALSLNFLFSEDNAVNNAVLTKGEATGKLNEMFEEKGIHVYDWLSLGNMQWTSNAPLETPEDFDGFKMRIMASPLIAANYEALGASPTNVAFMETYSALQLKTVDGTEQPLNAIEEMKFYEVQDYITMSNHAQMASFVAFNGEFYNSLSDEDKEIIDSIKEEMEVFAADTLETVLQEKFDTIMAEKPDMQVVELSEEQRQAFIDKSMSVRDDIVEYAGEEGKEIMELVIKDVEKYEKEING